MSNTNKRSGRGKPGARNVYRFLAGCAALALATQYAGAQTHVDLRTQSKSVDFSAASSTKPFQTGTTLSATCSLGQTFFKTNAAAGSNLYACTSPNTWTLEGGNAPGGSDTQIQFNNAGVFGGLAPGIVVRTDADATFGARTYNFSGATITPPSSFAGAGLAASGNSLIFDTTFGNTNYARVNAASTYGAFLQDFTLGSIMFPSQAGAIPTTANSWYWDSTNLVYKYGNGSVTRTVMSTAASVLGAQMPALTGDCTTSAGAVAVTCGAKLRTVSVGGSQVGAEDAAAALTTTNLTRHAFFVNDAYAKTLTEASCISDGGDQTVTVKIGATTKFSIHCVAPGAYSTGTTDGTTGYIIAASMGSTAIGAHAQLDLSGTANTTTKNIKLFPWGTLD